MQQQRLQGLYIETSPYATLLQSRPMAVFT